MSIYKPITLLLEFCYMSKGLAFEIFSIVFREIGSELTDKSTKNLRYRFTKIIMAQGIVVKGFKLYC